MGHGTTFATPDAPLATLTDQHRARLWRTFTAWTGQPAIADDLTQDTLLEAWRSTRRPESEPDLTRWLFGVARNVLQRHRREQGIRAGTLMDLPDDAPSLALASTSLDLDAELERDDIESLLDAALARLPAESRQALLLRYVDELPQRDIATRLGISEKALEGKLHRGKRAMHRYLVTQGRDQARSLGLVTPGDDWQVTNLWCDACGRQRLLGKWFEHGGFRLDCPSCTLLGGRRSHHSDGTREIAGGLRSFGAAMNRLTRLVYEESPHNLIAPGPCPDCGRRVDVVRFETGVPSLFEFWLRCTGCGNVRYRSSIGVTGSHPSFQPWIRRERRAEFDPATPVIERDGREAVVLRWQSLTGTGTWEAVRDRETLRYHLIAIDGRPISVEETGQDRGPSSATMDS